jgi:hypothetical protein
VSNLVQPILIRKGGTHLESIALAAGASMVAGASGKDVAVWNEWLSGPFTKTVRRASDKEFAKVIYWADANGFHYKDVEAFGNRALALSPMTYESFPKCLAKLQVSGTDFERLGDTTITGTDATIYLDESLTTGKAAAQAAHAMWIASGMVGDIAASEDRGVSVGITLYPYKYLHWLSGRDDAVAIRDNGLTEVAPNTMTALVIPEGNMKVPL